MNRRSPFEKVVTGQINVTELNYANNVDLVKSGVIKMRKMSKKKYRELMYANEPNYINSMSLIETEILMLLELETRNNIVIDTNGQPLVYQNKFINFPKDVIQDKNIVAFDIFNNARLMQFLFTIYIRNYQMNNSIPIQQFFLTPLTPEGYGSAVMRSEQLKSDITSDIYYNESIRYIDLILRNEGSMILMSNNQILHEIDNYMNFIKEEKLLAAKKG